MNLQYNYDQYMDNLRTLLFKVKQSEEKYTHIVGIVRGGCIPGVHISNILDIPFTPLIWSHTRNEKDSNHAILKNTNNKCLIVDDILDAGSTLVEVMQAYPNTDTAVLIYNCTNQYSIVPTYAAWTIDRETTPQWFDFWWEKV